MTNAVDATWLNLFAANGLEIPYVGYALVDFWVGGVHVPEKVLIIVNDGCLGSDRGIG